MEPKRGGAKEGVAGGVGRSDPYQELGKEWIRVLEAFWSLSVWTMRLRKELGLKLGAGTWKVLS